MFGKECDEMQDFKKKREEYIINIRKNNREEIFNKRRNIVNESQTISAMSKNQHFDDLQYAKQLQREMESFDHIEEYVAMVNSPCHLTMLKGIESIRNLIDMDQDQKRTEGRVVEEIMKRGLIHKIVSCLSCNDPPQLKKQAIGIISSITFAKNACAQLIKHNIIQTAIKLLHENESPVVDFAIIIVGNISAQSINFRDLLLKAGALQALYKIINSSNKTKSVYLNSLWGLTNLCRGNPLPKYPRIDSVIPIFCRQLKNELFTDLQKGERSKIYSDVLWTLSLMVAQSKPRADRLIESNVLPIIIKCLLNQNINIHFPALNIVSSLTMLGQQQTNAILNNGFLQLAVKLLGHPKKLFRKEMCLALSNIACGTSQQVSNFISRKDILDKISQMFSTEDPAIKSEICWIYYNFGFMDDKKRVLQLYLYYDIMRKCVDILDDPNVILLETVLKCLQKFFLIANKVLTNGSNIMLMKFMEYGGIQKISRLQGHDSNKIYKAVVDIMTRFFQIQAEE